MAKSIPPDVRMPQDVVGDLIRQAAARGEIAKLVKDDAIIFAAAVIGIFLETAVYVLYERLPGPLSRYVDSVSQASLRVLRKI